MADSVADELAEQPAQPIPLRYWWLKRLAAVAAVFFLALLAVRWWWGHVAESRLQAKIAEYHAAGQPVLPADFLALIEGLPDEENGAHFLELAASQLAAWSHEPV